MSNVLVISGHPNLDESYTNNIILDELVTNLNQVSVRYLDRLYPDYQIDITAEQEALLAADFIVLQFPFYWYSVPALLKKWLDDVFSYNFAYGAKGDKLKGKHFMLSFTVGGPEKSYDPLGYNHFTIEQLIRPLQQTAYLAGLNYLPPLYTHSMVYIPGVYNKQEEVEQKAKEHAHRLITQITSITQSNKSLISQFVTEWFEKFDQLPDNPDYFIKHLSEAVTWSMPEDKFIGHAGFIDWYAIAKRTFKPGCDHQIEQIYINKLQDHYQVELRIRLYAESYVGSDLKGETVNMLVNETWKIVINDNKEITINDYQVVAV